MRYINRTPTPKVLIRYMEMSRQTIDLRMNLLDVVVPKMAHATSASVGAMGDKLMATVRAALLSDLVIDRAAREEHSHSDHKHPSGVLTRWQELTPFQVDQFRAQAKRTILGVEEVLMDKLRAAAPFPQSPSPSVHRPHRDDDVAAWLKRRRDEAQQGPTFNVIDVLLGRYRECADYGLTLRVADDSKGDA